MPVVKGRIGQIWASSREINFGIRLVDCDNGVPPKSFWVFKNGWSKEIDPHPPAPNFETIVALALWCASHGVRVTVTTSSDLKKDDLPLDEMFAEC
jgi:hypothetical protein